MCIHMNYESHVLLFNFVKSRIRQTRLEKGPQFFISWWASHVEWTVGSLRCKTVGFACM